MAKLFDEIMKFNPYHDAKGRFSSANGAASFTYSPGKSKAHDLAIQRAKERQAGNDEKATYSTITEEKAGQMAAAMLTEAERQAITENKGYFGAKNSWNINKGIRAGTEDSLSEEDQATIKLLDSSMRPLPENIQLVRKADTDFIEVLGINDSMSQAEINDRVVGGIVKESSYMSTSYDSSKIAGSMQSRPATITINAPKGTRAIIRPDQKEAEVLLARNTSYRIDSVELLKYGDMNINVTVLI